MATRIALRDRCDVLREGAAAVSVLGALAQPFGGTAPSPSEWGVPR